MLLIPPHIREQIGQHAAAHYPQECCGILLGEAACGTIRTAIRAQNSAPAETRHNRYIIDPFDILQADKTARAQHLEILGFYHSHPDHPAIPSRTDVSQAWPDYIYVIAALTATGAGEIRAWRLVAAEQPMREIELR